MIFITGPLYSGKRETAMRLLHCDEAALKTRCVCDAQELVREREDLDALADELAQYDAVIAVEVGCGVVPADPDERARRERAGRLACLLASRADMVVRVMCGILTVIKEEKR